MNHADNEVSSDVWRLGYTVVVVTCVNHLGPGPMHVPARGVLDKTSGDIYPAQIMCTLDRVENNLSNWEEV